MVEKFECGTCDKNFKSQEALDMHKNSKHLNEENKSGKVDTRKIRNWSILIMVLGLLVWGVYAMIQSQGKYNEFAQCLTENEVKMYGAYWCPACLDQKRAFGSSWDYINYVECSLPNRAGQTQECITEGIQSYPTWEFADGSRVSGIMSINQLNDRTGCLDESL